MAVNQRSSTYLAGIGVSHSIAPPMHDFVAASLGLPWKFSAFECPTVEEVVETFRKPSFAGGVVTMPYKITIMPLLDGIDELAQIIGAVNNVYRAQDGTLRGTNTDWRGIHGCLANADVQEKGKGQPALIFGAGGASRAAVYALHEHLSCTPIYVVNRDEQEVQALQKDCQRYARQSQPEIVHVRSLSQLGSLQTPLYIVGTVPDFEPTSAEEVEAREILTMFLSREQKGWLLDMCFKPRRTRLIKLAEQKGWSTIEGVDIIGYQITEQYRLWTGDDPSKAVTAQVQDGAFRTLRKAADESTSINF